MAVKWLLPCCWKSVRFIRVSIWCSCVKLFSRLDKSCRKRTSFLMCKMICGSRFLPFLLMGISLQNLNILFCTSPPPSLCACLFVNSLQGAGRHCYSGLVHWADVCRRSIGSHPAHCLFHQEESWRKISR